MSERNPALVALDVVGRIAPPLGAAVAEKLWFTPPRPQGAMPPLPPGLEPMDVPWRDRMLEGFTGGSGRRVLLVHGWGGHAGQMARLATALVGCGASVVAVTFPAHGTDPSARRTDVFEAAEALEATMDAHGEPDLVVAHSLGAMVAMRALASLRTPAVFLAPVLSIETAINGFAAQLDLSASVTQRLETRLRRYVGDEWSSLAVGAALEWGDELLLLHDPEDTQAPIGIPRAIAARNDDATLTEIPGAGHYRILRDDVAVAATADFAVHVGIVGDSMGIGH